MSSSQLYNQQEIKEKIILTCIRMLNDRNIIITSTNTTFNKDDECKLIDNIKKIHLIKLIPFKLSSIKGTIIESLISNNINNHIILIFNFKEIPQKIITQLTEYDVELFREYELLFPVVDHDYVPTHIKLSEEESNIFMSEYKLTKNQLKKIYVTDPISRYYRYNVGDIIRIIAPSYSSGYSVSYRVVIE